MKKTKYSINQCNRCDHEWVGRLGKKPRVCASPKCHSPYWDSERVFDKKTGKRIV